MDIFPQTDSDAAVAALISGNADALGRILRSCIAPHLPTRTPENIAKRACQQLILLAPDSLLQLDWADDPELAEPFTDTLAEALRHAFLFHSQNIPIHRFIYAFAKPPLPPEPLAACRSLFRRDPSNPLSKTNAETKKVTLSRCKWRWALDLLLESGLTAEQSSAAQAFLIAAKSGGSLTRSIGGQHLSSKLQILHELIHEDTPQGRLAVDWLCALHDIQWGMGGSPDCSNLLALANARKEALAISDTCPGTTSGGQERDADAKRNGGHGQKPAL